jgi:hypothetical protein
MQRAFIFFLLVQKEDKKDPDKGLHPLCRKQQCGSPVHRGEEHLFPDVELG